MATEHQPEPALSAAKMIERYGYDLELATSVVLVFDAGLVPTRSTTRTQRRASHPFRGIGTLADGVDVVLAAGPGAPVAAITVEFLAAFGVRRMIAVGTAGSLSAAVDVTPARVAIASAESDEGTSAHFNTDLSADVELTAALIEATSAAPAVALTTDVPFRHTPERLASHRARADVVEMECAALFAAARHFDVRCGAVLATSDVFTHDAIWMPLDSAAVTSLLHENVQLATQILTSNP